NGIDDLPTIDTTIRKNIIERFERDGLEPLRFELKKIDPEYYETSDIKNPKRVMHALEIFYMTGKKYSSLRTNTKKQRDFNILKIGLNTDRKILHERINHRVDDMIKNGLVEEARSVFEFKHLNSLKTVGYKELFSYFENEIDLPTAIDLIKRNSRRYARRQLTWFNSDPEITWFDPANKNDILNFIKNKTGLL
ncbi:MAG: tRNA (adenosine(37)-N6)-dimethylallyltransferase MiaA, partial [Prolixibacteraceae bacterium]|nr:tRNA (adenosine(37)-N6)-dimethylallyltransferase MiaA [Prolixibacteraceae bacterium]